MKKNDGENKSNDDDDELEMGDRDLEEDVDYAPEEEAGNGGWSQRLRLALDSVTLF